MIYIIDGYNVLHARESGGEIGADELEGKRQRFIEEMVSYSATSGARCYIVFDSRRSSSSRCVDLPHTDVTVCYSSRLESADLFIGKLVQKMLAETEGPIRVVSADWEVQRGAMQERVERVPPRNLLSGLKEFAEKLAFSEKKDTIPGKLEHKVDVETLRKLERMRRGLD
jgi:predicted RNA-binding protein with PIN domain